MSARPTLPAVPVWLIVVIVVVVVLAVVTILTYNRLVGLRNKVDNAWAQIGVQLARRHDLVPNLVETVKGYAAHEASTLEAVTEARNQAVTARSASVAEEARAESALTGALRQLFALAESYPDLKANQGFLSLQEELSATESRIAYARQYFNDGVLRYNTAIQQFPTVLLARPLGFREREYFEPDLGAGEVPRVQF